jgi:hypothetical protein
LPAGFLNQAIIGFADVRWDEAPHGFVVLKQGAGADVTPKRKIASLLINFLIRPFAFLLHLLLGELKPTE